MLLFALLCLVPFVSGFICSDDCEIADGWVDDGYCDCLDCGDEADWDCDNCCCAPSCAEFYKCGETPAATCFKDMGFKKWGYTNGPYAVDEEVDYFTLPMYQAEGQCQVHNGLHTADVQFSYNAEIKEWWMYIISLQGYAVAEWHAYVGCEPLPRDRKGEYTVAPGKYPYADEFEELTTEAEFIDTLDQSCTDFYVVVHAMIYEEGEGQGKGKGKSAETAYMRPCVIDDGN